MITNKYNNSKIYKLYHPSKPEFCYIGSTYRKLNNVLSSLKSTYKLYSLKKKGSFKLSYLILMNSFDNDSKKFDRNLRIELISHFNCNDIDELKKKEGEFINSLTCVNKLTFDKIKNLTFDKNPPHSKIENNKLKNLTWDNVL